MNKGSVRLLMASTAAARSSRPQSRKSILKPRRSLGADDPMPR